MGNMGKVWNSYATNFAMIFLVERTFVFILMGNLWKVGKILCHKFSMIYSL